MKRLINPRLSLICAISAICGIVACHELLFGNWIVAAVCLCVIAVVVVVSLCRKSGAWKFAAFALAVFILASSLFGCGYVLRGETENYLQEGTLVGRVTDIGRNGKISNVIYLEKSTLDGEKVQGRVKVYTYDGEQFHSGDVVKINGTLRTAYAVQDEINTYHIRYGVRHEFSDIEVVSVTEGRLNLGEIIRKYVYDVTVEYMPLNGDVAYALLTGDRNAMDTEKEWAFSAAGIIHLLVVSGLHVGFVITVFGFVLKLFKLHPLAELAILLVPLLFYAYVCGFSPSVMRAVIMSCCVYFARALFGKYDLLTSLCWAVTLILLAQPFHLYDMGFQLSVMSVFGISTLYFQFDRWILRKIKNRVLNWLCGTLLMSFSCTFATAFILAYNSDSIAYLGIFVNVIAIPLVFVSFVLCFVGLLPSFFHHALWLSDHILEVVTRAAKFVEALNASLNFVIAIVGIIVCIVFLFVVGGYVNLKKKGKVIAYVTCFVLTAICLVTPFVPSRCTNSVRVFFGYRDTVVVATSQDNQSAYISNFNDSYASFYAERWLNGRYTVATVYIPDVSVADADSLRSFCCGFHVEKVYLLNYSDNAAVLNEMERLNVPVYRVQPNAVYGDSVKVQAVYDGGLAAVVVKTGTVTVANVLCEESKAIHFARSRTDVDYYAVSSNDVEAFDELCLRTLSFYQQNFATNFGANKYGNFTIKQKDDKIILNFRRN